jgi:hypothetical protein
MDENDKTVARMHELVAKTRELLSELHPQEQAAIVYALAMSPGIAEHMPSDVPDWMFLAGYDRVPRGWKRMPLPFHPFRFVELDPDVTHRLMVIVTGGVEGDGKRWLHVSMSRPDELPSYNDMCMVKEIFIGANKKAMQIFAPASEHVNISQFVLHLWHCIDGDGLPDFRRAGQL